MSGADRRTFLKRTAMASAAAAASSLFPGVTFGEEVVRYLGDSERSDAALVWRKTPCRFCGVGCGLLVGIEDGRAVAVRGDPDSPVNRGLACVKGYHSVQALYGQDRLRRALVRRGGRLVEVPLQEALDLVAERMRTTIDEHGKDGVAIYGSGSGPFPMATSRPSSSRVRSAGPPRDVRVRSDNGVRELPQCRGLLQRVPRRSRPGSSPPARPWLPRRWARLAARSRSSGASGARELRVVPPPERLRPVSLDRGVVPRRPTRILVRRGARVGARAGDVPGMSPGKVPVADPLAPAVPFAISADPTLI